MELVEEVSNWYEHSTMENSHANPLLPLFLAQSLFGLLYSILIHWISVKNYLRGSTAYSVVLGDAVTLFIQWLFIRDGWSPLVTFGSFAFSGLPMVITYLFRYQQKVSHKRRSWPTHASAIRDDVNMSITALIKDIEEAAKEERITAGFLIGVINSLHLLKKTLNSV